MFRKRLFWTVFILLILGAFSSYSRHMVKYYQPSKLPAEASSADEGQVSGVQAQSAVNGSRPQALQDVQPQSAMLANAQGDADLDDPSATPAPPPAGQTS